MTTPRTIEADLCVIGAGAAGLTVAAGAAQLGAKTVLIERGAMGGECLNSGCVPSKALLAAADRAAAPLNSSLFGVNLGEARVDGGTVRAHIANVIATLAPQDSVARFEGLGVTVLAGEARFVGRRELRVDDDATVRARRLVVATGSRPLVPPIPGLSETPFLTNETLFALSEIPAHLVILGGGPIGCEMAQAYRRLGARVSVLDQATILPRDDPELVAVVRERLQTEGVTLHEHVAVQRVAGRAGALAVVVADEKGGTRALDASHLLIAAGRQATVAGLDLETAGIAYTPQGIAVDRRLRTTNKHVYAVGDVVGPHRFTHAAGYQAGIVLRNALFRLPARVDYRAMPWCTFTDPELAQVGATEAQARDRFGERLTVLGRPFADNDRAVTERRTQGRIKVMVRANGKVVGAGIVGPHAGELIQPWGLAIAAGLGIGALARMIAPYPTLAEINKRVAGDFYAPRLFSPRVRWLVSLLKHLG